jgi:hypothetical protein
VFNVARTGEPRADTVAGRPSSARFDTPPSAEAIAHEVRRTRDGGAPVARIIQAAGDADPELADLWQEIQDERHDRMAELAQMLRAADLLREDIGLQEATDILWTLTSNDNYTHLVLERGWSPEQYEHWLEGVLATSLMREDGTGA